MTYTIKDYKSSTKPSWCPGCGDYAVLTRIIEYHD
jgi:2-oxoglutarate ferredoxin oxidoreductase subunit beta